MYHSITDNRGDPHAIPPAEFQKQMKALETKHVVSLSEAMDLLRSDRPLRNIYVITFDDAYLDFQTNALPVLREFGYPATMFVPTGLVGSCAVWDSFDKSKPLMTWKQLEECQQGNVAFASHTVTHARLTECSDAVLMDELQISLQMLEDNLDQVIPALAYPGGLHDERVRQAAQRVGYCCAFGAASRWGNGPESNLYQLRRQRFTI